MADLTSNAKNRLRAAVGDNAAANELITILNAVDVLSAAEAGFTDGVTAGTALASKALVLGASKEVEIITTLGLTNLKLTPIGASTAAAGSTTADAGVLPAGTSSVYPTTAADDTKGVRVHANDAVTGKTLFIGNNVANKILKVYGPSGAVINGASADAAFSSVSGKGVILHCISGAGNTWLGF